MVLYGTLGCHLCDEARSIVVPIFELNNIDYQEVDIATSDRLIERYGIAIPVVKSDVTGNELAWPFDVTVFVEWLENN